MSRLIYFSGSPKYESLTWIEKINSLLPSIVIYNIAKRTNIDFYIGIKGGKDALSLMEPEIIENKQWSVSLSKRTNQWVEKDEFLKIIDKKGLFV